jgi:hypothetical protein
MFRASTRRGRRSGRHTLRSALRSCRRSSRAPVSWLSRASLLRGFCYVPTGTSPGTLTRPSSVPGAIKIAGAVVVAQLKASRISARPITPPRKLSPARSCSSPSPRVPRRARTRRSIEGGAGQHPSRAPPRRRRAPHDEPAADAARGDEFAAWSNVGFENRLLVRCHGEVAPAGCVDEIELAEKSERLRALMFRAVVLAQESAGQACNEHYRRRAELLLSRSAETLLKLDNIVAAQRRSMSLPGCPAAACPTDVVHCHRHGRGTIL